MDTELFDRAAKFAIDAHRGVERRGKGFPYVLHPMEAASIVATMTTDQELLAATILHDVVEDTDVSVDDIAQNFGPRVAALVAYESDCEIAGSSESTWRERKRIGIERIANATREEQMISMGDKLSNMRIIARDYAVIGDSLWNRFHVKEKSQHKWRYEALVEAFRPLADTDAYKEFKQLVEQVFI